MNCSIALGADWSCQNITGCDRTAMLRQHERWPRPLVTGKVLMGLLHLLTGEVPYHVQIQTDQSKGERDRCRVFICRLSSESVDNVLVNKRWIAMGQGVTAQLVIRIKLGHTGHRPARIMQHFAV